VGARRETGSTSVVERLRAGIAGITPYEGYPPASYPPAEPLRGRSTVVGPLLAASAREPGPSLVYGQFGMYQMGSEPHPHPHCPPDCPPLSFAGCTLTAAADAGSSRARDARAITMVLRMPTSLGARSVPESWVFRGGGIRARQVAGTCEASWRVWSDAGGPPGFI
jgi:hypothetical protein